MEKSSNAARDTDSIAEKKRRNASSEAGDGDKAGKKVAWYISPYSAEAIEQYIKNTAAREGRSASWVAEETLMRGIGGDMQSAQFFVRAIARGEWVVMVMSNILTDIYSAKDDYCHSIMQKPIVDLIMRQARGQSIQASVLRKSAGFDIRDIIREMRAEYEIDISYEKVYMESYLASVKTAQAQQNGAARGYVPYAVRVLEEATRLGKNAVATLRALEKIQEIADQGIETGSAVACDDLVTCIQQMHADANLYRHPAFYLLVHAISNSISWETANMADICDAIRRSATHQ